MILKLLMKKLYYPLWYRLDNRDRYLLWCNVEDTDQDLDNVVLDENGKIFVFASLDDLFNYAQSISIEIEKSYELNLHNLDELRRWLKIKRSKTEGPTAINRREFLAAWNLFSDVSRSIDGSFDAEREKTQRIYEKLFWGNNLPSVTPEGRFYVPLWSGKEKRIIKEVLSQGLQMFRNHIKHQK